MTDLAAIRDELCEEALVCLLTGREEEARELLARARRMYAGAVRQVVSRRVSLKKRSKNGHKQPDFDRPYWDDEP